MLFSETKIKAFSATQTVLTKPNVTVGGHCLEKPWYPVGKTGYSAFLLFQKVPHMVQIIVLELPFLDNNNKRVFSLTFKRI